MDVELFIQGASTPAYQQWYEAHPNSTPKEQESMAYFVMPDIFQNWQKAHPNGTVDQYLMEVRQKNMLYHNSGQYKIDQLEEEVNNLKTEIDYLHTQILYYEEDNSDLLENCNLLKTTTVSFALLSGVLAFMLWRKCH